MSTFYYFGPSIDELYHHGIKGQHWGVRRFQNDDGTLTALGKVRYGRNSPQRKQHEEVLARRKREAAEKEEAEKREVFEREKARVLNVGTAKEVLEYKQYLTTQELQNAFQRIDATAKLTAQAQKDAQATFNKIDRTISKVGKMNNWITTGINIGKNAKTIKSFIDKTMEGTKEEKKKSKDKSA